MHALGIALIIFGALVTITGIIAVLAWFFLRDEGSHASGYRPYPVLRASSPDPDFGDDEEWDDDEEYDDEYDPDDDNQTEMFYGWPSKVAYYADVAQVDAILNSGYYASTPWIKEKVNA